MRSVLKRALCGCTLAIISIPSHAALLGRDLDTGIAGFEAYYDTVLNITWLGDANYAQTSGYDFDGDGGEPPSSLLTWENAVTWANNLDVYGYNNWRLPTMMDTGTAGCATIANSGTDCGYNVQTTDAVNVYSEMASLYYDTLGNQALLDSNGNNQSPSGMQNTGPFTNVESNSYWSGVEYAPNTYSDRAWYFGTDTGIQYASLRSDKRYAWAVRSGDVSAVPLPAAAWLLGSGLMGMMIFRRFKR